MSPRIGIQIALALALVAAASAGAQQLIKSKPSAGRRPPAERHAALVEVVPVSRGAQRVRVEASGTVIPARQVVLTTRVRGEVIEVNERLVPGGRLAEGDLVARIDATEYQLIARQAESALAAAEAALALELGSQAVARVERAQIKAELAPESEALVLRKPQLATAESNVASARAALERARLDVRRTRVTAPFAAVVTARQVDAGARVTDTSPLATLVGTDTWWIEAQVPVEDLRWIALPRAPGEPGSSVRIAHESAWGEGASRTGRVLELAAGLEEKGRLARVLIAVDDPLALLPENAGAPRLFLGAWVRLEIEGRPLDDAVALDPALVRDGERAWVMDAEGKLDIRPIRVAFRGRDAVLVADGLRDGERVVASAIPAPVQGMRLRTAAAGSHTAGPPGGSHTAGPPKHARGGAP